MFNFCHFVIFLFDLLPIIISSCIAMRKGCVSLLCYFFVCGYIHTHTNLQTYITYVYAKFVATGHIFLLFEKLKHLKIQHKRNAERY
jgi:hypothetical protein